MVPAVPLASTINAKKLVLVEGQDEVNLLGGLQQHLGLNNIEIRSLSGVYGWRARLKAVAQTPGFASVVSLGVMRDAESDANAAFQSVCDALREAGQAVPGEQLTLKQGANGNPSVIILILPYGASNGMLEDVCLQSVADDPAMKCVDGYFQCLNQRLKTLPQNLSKAKTHAFLSSREKPDLRLGEAANAGYWTWDSQAFDAIKQFFSAL